MHPEQLLAFGLEQAGLPRKGAYTTGQVARILGVSSETVRRLIDQYTPARADGTGAVGLRAVRITTHRRVPYDALLEWLQNNTVYSRDQGHGPWTLLTGR